MSVLVVLAVLTVLTVLTVLLVLELVAAGAEVSVLGGLWCSPKGHLLPPKQPPMFQSEHTPLAEVPIPCICRRGRLA